jgi:Cu(I)/Ag(I) efflux system membrane protein CusA/SilA
MPKVQSARGIWRAWKAWIWVMIMHRLIHRYTILQNPSLPESSTGRRRTGFLSLLAAGIAGGGNYRRSKTPLDAIPDLSDTQVIIRTDWPGQAPQIIEDQVTFPAVHPHVKSAKNKSRARLFHVWRQLYLHRFRRRCGYVLGAQPRTGSSCRKSRAIAGRRRPQLGPDATGVGWVFQYALDRPHRKA